MQDAIPAPQPTLRTNKKKFSFTSTFIQCDPAFGSKSNRITVAQQKRNSQKAKNRARHKAACRR
jgi:hypothetical protein